MNTKYSKYSILLILIFIYIQECSANVVIPAPREYYWDHYSTLGTRASCGISIQGDQLLSKNKKLIVDNRLPNGTVLHRDVLSNISIYCNKTTEFPDFGNSDINGNTNRVAIGFIIMGGDLDESTETFRTNNPGIGFKLYINLMNKGYAHIGYDAPPGIDNTSSSSFLMDIDSMSMNTMELNKDYQLLSPAGIQSLFFPILSQRHFSFDHSSNYSQYVLIGELIKISDIVENKTELTLTQEISPRFFFRGYDTLHNIAAYATNNAIDIGGIEIIKPSCQLMMANYDVYMGLWMVKQIGNNPEYGSMKPINIDIECSGAVDNVEFSFQDMGDSPLDNRNISVYDEHAQLIEGLEIEMFYNGSRLNIHSIGEDTTTYKTNTGSHGNIKIDASDLSFNSKSQIQFNARFIQRDSIKRNGESYTGKVTGAVNMFITYH